MRILFKRSRILTALSSQLDFRYFASFLKLPLSMICILTASSFLSACNPQSEVKDDFLIPEGYTGWVAVDYYVKGAPPLPLVDGCYVRKIPITGWLKTSSNRGRRLDVGEFYSCSNNSRKRLAESGSDQMIWAFVNSIGSPEFRDQFHKVGNHTEAGGSVIVSDIFFVGTGQQFNLCSTATDGLESGPNFGGIEKWSEQINSESDNWLAYILRGNCQASIGPAHYPQAIDDFTKEIELARKYRASKGSVRKIEHSGFSEEQDVDYFIGEGYSERAQVYLRLKESSKALDDITKAIGLHPTPWEIGRRADAIQNFKLLENYYYVRAKIYIELKRYQQAIGDIKTAKRLYSKDWRLYKLSAKAHEKLGQYESAIDDYSNSISLIKTGLKFINQRSALYRDRANCYEHLGKLSLAQKGRDSSSNQSNTEERKANQ